VADDFSHLSDEKIRKLKGQLKELAFPEKFRLADVHPKGQC
jgi:hypothetical protein